ncbi:MAG: lipopolysaccharide heptosyltransferase II [Bryobacterales bacterium]|nr:lipopolysaccharide heptosyltransferase II [Bryobacterales bacterium]
MEFRRILVRATNWIGDAVMTIPAIAEIRHRFPDARITLLARPWVAGLYDNSLVDDIFPYHLARGAKDLPAKWRLARQLRKLDFDCAILLPNSFDSAALLWAARIPVRIGYARDGRGLLLTDPITPPKPGEIPDHQRFYYLELLRRAGLIDRIPDVASIRLPGIPHLVQHGRNLLRLKDLNADWIGVSPGAAFGSAKRWLPERFAEAAIQLARHSSAGVALFGSQDERALCHKIEKRIAAENIPVHNFAGETKLDEFIAIASTCTAFLTNDSGAMHIASALGVPTVTVFGATDHIATGPTGPLARIVRQQVECSPCLLRECPIDHRCMTAVPSSLVVKEALELIQLNKP